MDVLERTVRNVVPQFASFLSAYDECSPEVQEVIREMSQIILSNETDADEKMHAIDVFVEALFPGLTRDAIEADAALQQTDEFKVAVASLDEEEAAFAARVRKLMHDKEMTQEDLAKATGVTQPAIANILNRNCRPQQRTIARFAEALEVDPSELWPNR